MPHIFTFHNAPNNFIELIKDAFTPSVFQYIAHFEKLEGLHLESFYYAPVHCCPIVFKAVPSEDLAQLLVV